jgi:steroid delta-isomerase-like uncharacterized protein
MSAEDTIHKGLEAINRHDAAAFAATYATSATVMDPQYPEPLRGRDGVLRDMQDFLTAFPDLQGRLRTLVTNGETYAGEFEMNATHKGPLAGPEGQIAPTNRSVQISAAVFGRVDGQGQITDERRYFDLAGVFAQLGVA